MSIASDIQEFEPLNDEIIEHAENVINNESDNHSVKPVMLNDNSNDESLNHIDLLEQAQNDRAQEQDHDSSPRSLNQDSTHPITSQYEAPLLPPEPSVQLHESPTTNTNSNANSSNETAQIAKPKTQLKRSFSAKPLTGTKYRPSLSRLDNNSNMNYSINNTDSPSPPSISSPPMFITHVTLNLEVYNGNLNKPTIPAWKYTNIRRNCSNYNYSTIYNNSNNSNNNNNNKHSNSNNNNHSKRYIAF